MSNSKRLRTPHLLDTASLMREEIDFLFALARKFRRGDSFPPLLQGKTVAHLFFENSTRTRLSFERAVRQLGGLATHFTTSTSSLSKGETLVDTARNLEAIGADAFVIRHFHSGSASLLAAAVNRPVVNAGDGTHEHPTQGLLDSFTLAEHFKDLSGKHVVILGDILHSRVARSNIHVLSKLQARVTVCGPPTLIPLGIRSLGVDISYELDTVLPGADAVICLRIQKERQDQSLFPSLREYSRFWGLHADRTPRMKSSAVVLHPGPINRGIELDTPTADGQRSLILEQVANGVAMRMAVLAAVLNPEGAARHA